MQRHALPRRIFRVYVAELVEQFDIPIFDKEWFPAMILRFEAVVRLVRLEIEQIFCEIMLYHMICSILHSMKAPTGLHPTCFKFWIQKGKHLLVEV